MPLFIGLHHLAANERLASLRQGSLVSRPGRGRLGVPGSGGQGGLDQARKLQSYQPSHMGNWGSDIADSGLCLRRGAFECNQIADSPEVPVFHSTAVY